MGGKICRVEEKANAVALGLLTRGQVAYIGIILELDFHDDGHGFTRAARYDARRRGHVGWC